MKIAAIVIGMMAVGLVLLRVYFASEREAREDREHAAALANESRARIARLMAMEDRLPEILKTVRIQRLEMIDSKCAAKGKPPLGYSIQGGAADELVYVGLGAGCTTYGPTNANITNFFCCPRGVDAGTSP